MNHYDKRDFPLLAASPIAYLDNAATAQRPECVIQAEDTFYRQYNANPLRGLYPLSSLEYTRRSGCPLRTSATQQI